MFIENDTDEELDRFFEKLAELSMFKEFGHTGKKMNRNGANKEEKGIKVLKLENDNMLKKNF